MRLNETKSVKRWERGGEQRRKCMFADSLCFFIVCLRVCVCVSMLVCVRTLTRPTYAWSCSSMTVRFTGSEELNSGSLSLTSVTTMFTVAVEVYTDTHTHTHLYYYSCQVSASSRRTATWRKQPSAIKTHKMKSKKKKKQLWQLFWGDVTNIFWSVSSNKTDSSCRPQSTSSQLASQQFWCYICTYFNIGAGCCITICLIISNLNIYTRI